MKTLLGLITFAALSYFAADNSGDVVKDELKGRAAHVELALKEAGL